MKLNVSQIVILQVNCFCNTKLQLFQSKIENVVHVINALSDINQFKCRRSPWSNGQCASPTTGRSAVRILARPNPLFGLRENGQEKMTIFCAISKAIFQTLKSTRKSISEKVGPRVELERKGKNNVSHLLSKIIYLSHVLINKRDHKKCP